MQESEFVLGLQEEARREKLPIHVGIHEPCSSSNSSSQTSESEQQQRIKNTVIWINEQGEIAHRYQKIHLFDVDIKDGPVLKESQSVEPGMKIEPPFETAVGRVGAMICFDVSFLSFFLSISQCYPSLTSQVSTLLLDISSRVSTHG